jgi:molecular chaperone GrpE (heat shock protein)
MSSPEEQYQQMRKAFQENVSAIRDLLDQVDNLNQIVTTIEDNNARDRLAKSIEGLHKTIDSLIKHTDYLFEQLIKYATILERSKTT